MWLVGYKFSQFLLVYCRRQSQNNILFNQFFVWTSCSCMLEQRKTTCWLNNVVQTWYNMLFRHDEVTRLNNHVTTLVNMVVLSLMFSPVPTAMNSYCWFIIAEQCCWNNSEQHCWHDSSHVTSTVEPTVLQQLVLCLTVYSNQRGLTKNNIYFLFVFVLRSFLKVKVYSALR